MVIEVLRGRLTKKRERKREKRERFFLSPQNHRPFWLFILFSIHVLPCHIVELACVFYHVCSLMGWLDVIRSVLMQVLLLTIKLARP